MTGENVQKNEKNACSECGAPKLRGAVLGKQFEHSTINPGSVVTIVTTFPRLVIALPVCKAQWIRFRYPLSVSNDNDHDNNAHLMAFFQDHPGEPVPEE